MDVSDPAHPAELAFCHTASGGEDVTGAGNLAYVADGQGGLDILFPLWGRWYFPFATRGGVSSYEELPWPMGDRLTDEA